MTKKEKNTHKWGNYFFGKIYKYKEDKCFSWWLF